MGKRYTNFVEVKCVFSFFFSGYYTLRFPADSVGEAMSSVPISFFVLYIVLFFKWFSLFSVLFW